MSAARASLPDGWTLSASAFNWTPDVIRAERSAIDLGVGIVADGVATIIEVEAGQVWRTYPEPSDAEVDDLAERLKDTGGSVSIVGASIDDWSSPTRRRDDDERFAFVLPQLHAAARLGAEGVRLPIGHAGPDLLRRVQPVLHELDITWFEEAQGQQAPAAAAREVDTIAELDDPHVRLLVDLSMLMPAVPVSYLDRITGSGLPDGPGGSAAARVARAGHGGSGDGRSAVRRGSPAHPRALHGSRRTFRPLVRPRPARLAAARRRVTPQVLGSRRRRRPREYTDPRRWAPSSRAPRFMGTLCSEWGGHAWLDDDATVMTTAHLELARTALAEGVASS